jgi:uncharacterized protein (TIGR03643 family)
MKQTLLLPDVADRIVQMAWEDRTPFEAIESQFGLTEKEVIQLMRRELKRNSFERWRKRVHGRATKHLALRDESVARFKCSRQRHISSNKISKR